MNSFRRTDQYNGLRLKIIQDEACHCEEDRECVCRTVGSTIVNPPSMNRVCPVINDAWSEVRNRVAAAISSGRPERPNSEVVDSHFALAGSSGSGDIPLVLIQPGAMAFERIPNFAYSPAMLRVNPSSPAFIVPYNQ